MADPSVAAKRSWSLTYEKRPATMNTIYGSWHYHQRAKHVKEWRKAFKDLAEDAGIPLLGAIGIEVFPILGDRRTQDVAACAVGSKAAIDGLVDAGVIPDDTPEYFRWEIFYPPHLPETPDEKGRNALTIVIHELE